MPFSCAMIGTPSSQFACDAPTRAGARRHRPSELARMDRPRLDGARMDGARMDGARLEIARMDLARMDRRSGFGLDVPGVAAASAVLRLAPAAAGIAIGRVR